jgi:hypothetical protein
MFVTICHVHYDKQTKAKKNLTYQMKGNLKKIVHPMMQK